MRFNLESSDGSLMARSVMMGLAQHIGRTQVNERVSAAALIAVERDSALRTESLGDPGILEGLGADEIDRLLDPNAYLGDTGAMVDRVLERAEAAS